MIQRINILFALCIIGTGCCQEDCAGTVIIHGVVSSNVDGSPCADFEIAQEIERVGGQAVMTAQNHQSGSDRIYEALIKVDPLCEHDCIINYQGDLPCIDPKVISAVLMPLENKNVDIATLVSKITDVAEINDSNVVKVAVGFKEKERIGRALYFSRTGIPFGLGPRFHHIGLYAYRRDILKKFVNLSHGVIEKRENLEQLRALENGLRIDVGLVDTTPLGVDTPKDLEVVRKILKNN